MSLKDATKKMSKSDRDDASRINITDSADTIRQKIRKAKTDSITGFTFDTEKRPEKSNLLTIFAAVTGSSVEDLCRQYADASALSFKDELAEAVIAKLAPMGREFDRMMKDSAFLDSVLEDGAQRARAIAADTMASVPNLGNGNIAHENNVRPTPSLIVTAMDSRKLATTPSSSVTTPAAPDSAALRTKKLVVSITA